MALPTGTVTFLFTDIEGSTRLWEEQPEAMRQALARHNKLLADAIRGAGGHVFNKVGDAFYAAFARADEAVSTALSAQQAVRAEPWPNGATIRVRMALHTGTADLDVGAGGYYGPALNRAARLLAAGHGGQILLSAPVQQLVQDQLPPGATLRALGEHGLRDLGRPESIFQLCHHDLTSSFPPLRSMGNPALKNNLPLQLTSFIGRERELAEVRALLNRSRLVTLIGTGGCGKTRLALQSAADLLDASGDGVWLVELAALADPGLVTQTVAKALGVKEEPGRAILQTLTDRVQARHLLLILDNCEHLLIACARIADTLLRSCPNVLILATSREALGISGEITYRVPSLASPDPAVAQTPESLARFEAARLFIDRAMQAQPRFTVTNRNAPALAAVCNRLDGIPLAIELATARVRSLSVEEINQRLDHRFRLLTLGSRTALPRHQTLRSLIDWSYDLLNVAEKALLRRLSVFADGWTLGAAEAVCEGDPVEESETLDLLTNLCDKSLVVYEEQAGQGRYRFLETVRQYAREKLEQSGEAEPVRRKHQDYFLRYAEEAEVGLTGSEQVDWLERLDREHGNLRAALEWCIGEESAGAGLRLCGALTRYWWTRGSLAEGREWCERALGKAGSHDRTRERAKALIGAGGLASYQGDYASARTYLEEGLSIRREIGDRSGIATSLNNLGNVAYLQGDYASAQTCYEESLAIRREIGERNGIAASLNNLGNVAYRQGEYASATAYYEGGLSIQRETGDRRGIAASLNNLGNVASDQGDCAATRTYYTEGISIQREIGDRWGVAYSLEAFARLMAEQRMVERAARLWGAAEALREEIGAPLPPNKREEYDRHVDQARRALGAEAFSRSWAEGRAITMADAIALALEEANA